MKRIWKSAIAIFVVASTIYADTFGLQEGWNLIGSSKNIELNSSFNNPDIVVVWTYCDGEWKYYAPNGTLAGFTFMTTLPANRGAWVYSKRSMVINTSSNDVNLTDEQKYALAYMWNEEKLAKDIYLALYDLYQNQTFYNIATRSETQHEAAVEKLVQKYDINITNLKDYTISYSEEELRALEPGEYAIPEIQELYDTLYAKGTKSLQDALEVGCMVEVTDVDDLDKYIAIAGDNEDLVSTFEFLRNGSYNHYWAFDRALKNIGVEEGCCVLGEHYCKTLQEYPSSNGQGRGR